MTTTSCAASLTRRASLATLSLVATRPEPYRTRMRQLGKIGGEFRQDRQHRFVVRIDAENDFVLGIIQPAETGQVFVRRPDRVRGSVSGC